ncbi:large ribosomal subunit protein mL54 isoform X1 [Temnothorax nylanderi]|uniref:large ribosomal subunit protein mL54 isoform X1 n=1 Tax=Temnothorax nylanderi TaxID=102681 RepID=UPI003A848A20
MSVAAVHLTFQSFNEERRRRRTHQSICSVKWTVACTHTYIIHVYVRGANVGNCYILLRILTDNKAIRPGVKKSKKTLVAIEKKVLPVETDVNRLLTHVCGTNIYKEGGEDVELKPDSEYPSWLWNIRTGPPPPLEELDPNTKQYWRRLRLLGLRRNNKERTTRKF